MTNQSGQSGQLSIVGNGGITVRCPSQPRDVKVRFVDAQKFIPCNVDVDELDWKIEQFAFRGTVVIDLVITWNLRSGEREIEWDIDF